MSHQATKTSAVEILQSSWQHVPAFEHPHGKKGIYLYLTEFPVFQLLPFAYHPTTVHHREEPGSIFFASSNHTAVDTIKISPEPSIF